MKSSKSSFPLNAWCAAACDVEVARSLLSCTICKQKLVPLHKLDRSVALEQTAPGAPGTVIAIRPTV